MDWAKEYRQTLRYRSAVAGFAPLPLYKKEAALLREIAVGNPWRAEAAIEAISAVPGDWGRADLTGILTHAAMFGRLETVRSLCDLLDLNGAHRAAVSAFYTAVTHGHYDVADYLLTRGVKADYHLAGATHPMVIALSEENMRKIDYLLENGVNPGRYLKQAVAEGRDAMALHLVSRGARPDGQMLVWAVNAGRLETADMLVKSGIDIGSSPREALLSALRRLDEDPALRGNKAAGNVARFLRASLAQRPMPPAFHP